MINKIIVIPLFIFLAITTAYAISPEQLNSILSDPNAPQIIIDKANKGDPNYQCVLGYMYANGKGVPQDYNEAINWYKKAAEKDNVTAQFNLGQMYENGKGVPQDYNETVKWYTKAADKGFPYAQHSLGLMYESGEGVSKNYNKAIEWFTKAAEQGLPYAQWGSNQQAGLDIARESVENSLFEAQTLGQGYALLGIWGQIE